MRYALDTLTKFFVFQPNMVDEEVLILRYKTTNNSSYSITFYINTYDEYIAISLYYAPSNLCIYDIGISHVEEIIVKDNKLFITKHNQTIIALSRNNPYHLIGNNNGLII